MENENENLDSLNEENDTEGETEDVNALKEQLKTLGDKNRQLFERAKKAEGFDKVNGKWVKKTSEPEPVKPEREPVSQPNQPDYGRLAFLKAEGIIHQEDVEFVEKEAKTTGKSLNELLSFSYVKEKLNTQREQREAQAGMPEGGGRGSGASGSNTVEYHLAKGTTPEDQELAEKVVEARKKGDASQKMFSDVLYN